jgi:hypothetical protein
MIQETKATLGALEIRRQFDADNPNAPEHGRIEWLARAGMGQFRDEDFAAASRDLFGATEKTDMLERQAACIRELQEINTILNEQLSQARTELRNLAKTGYGVTELPVAGTIGEEAGPEGQLKPSEAEVSSALESTARLSTDIKIDSQGNVTGSDQAKAEFEKFVAARPTLLGEDNGHS